MPLETPNTSVVTEVTTVSLEIAKSMLTSFNGNKRDLSEFIDNCDEALNLVNTSYKNILLTLIKTKITGNARLLIKDREFIDWNTLKTYLLEAYSDVRTAGQWQLELNSCRQTANENVRSYANKIERCYINLLKTLDKNLNNEGKRACIDLLRNQALNAFLMGLNRELAILVKSREPRTLEEAITLAQSEENEYLSKTEISKFQRVNDQTTRHCIHCNKPGHSSFNCFHRNKRETSIKTFSPQNSKPWNNNQSNYKPSNQNNFQKNAKQCNYCKKFGHVISECRKRQYNNQKRNQNLNSEGPSGTATMRTTHQIQAELV